MMKSMIKYLALDEPMIGAGEAQFVDDVAEWLHDRTVYDILRRDRMDMHPTLITSLLESLDDHDIELIDKCTDWFEVKALKRRLLDGRKERSKPKNVTHRLNYPIEEVLDDYVSRRKGKLVEAKRQLKKRFDGLDHPMQEKVMMAFMESGNLPERNFIAEKLYGEDFWTDAYIPLVQQWWEGWQDRSMAKVVVKRCPREYILTHLEELRGKCSEASICLKTGLEPDPKRMLPRTYIFVKKSIGSVMGFGEGEEVVLRWVRQYLYEEASDEPVHSIYDIPYVKRMMAYLGEMGCIEDIMALDTFEKRMRPVPRRDWGTAVIKAIEEEFGFPEFVYGEVQ